MFDRPDQAPRRALLLRYLRDVRAWGEEPLAQLFGPADPGPAELLAGADRLDPDGPGEAPPRAELTPREVQSMRNDYRLDPYMTPAQRREALRWIASRWPTAGSQAPAR